MKLKLTILILILFGSISSNAIAQTEKYLQQNIAITDLEYIDQNDGSFIIKLTLTDFGGKNQLPPGFALNGVVFSDDGKKNDPKAGDGIYYSHERGDYKKISGKTPKNKTFMDVTFKHGSKLGRGTGISCKFKKCGCPCPGGVTCPVCIWWGWSCWEVTECEIGIDIEILLL
ncbi:MAG: hypothetical protein ABJM06_10420 [Gilvibacter sp.]